MQTIKPLLPKAFNVVSHCLKILKHSSSKKGLRLMFMKYFEEGIQKGNRGRRLVFIHYMSVKVAKEIDHSDSDEYSKRCGRCSYVLALCHNLNTRNAGATRGGGSLEGCRGKLPWQEDEEDLIVKSLSELDTYASLDLLPKISLWAKSADYDRALPWYYKNITDIEEYNGKDLIELIEFNTISISIGDLPPLLYGLIREKSYDTNVLKGDYLKNILMMSIPQIHILVWF
ncbi:hypothetical protein F8388_012988 [Cannabis sativa]|uniref:Uncharacterized protein n=1 Tax=Cannabis sativa TaxID=3483 RepID=A0A7J6E9U0_CANSA|nr:hypothetical protein F8388_012988 [Cannabis sativa]